MIQTGLLRGEITAEPVDDERALARSVCDFEIEALVHQAADLAGRTRFDAAFVLNKDAEEVPRITLVAGEHVDISEPTDLQDAVDKIRAFLENAVTTQDEAALEDETTRKLLVVLARHGSLLYKALLDRHGGVLTGTERLQIVAVEPEAYLPLEFVYDRTAPSMDAKLCPNARQALATGSCDGCPALTDASFVCPLGFWCLSKVIERHLHKRNGVAGVEGDYRVQNAPTSTRTRLAALSSAVFGASSRVDQFRAGTIDEVAKAVDAATGSTRPRAKTWAEWVEAVSSAPPPLLVVLPHTLLDESSILALEIEDAQQLSVVDIGETLRRRKRAHRRPARVRDRRSRPRVPAVSGRVPPGRSGDRGGDADEGARPERRPDRRPARHDPGGERARARGDVRRGSARRPALAPGRRDADRARRHGLRRRRLDPWARERRLRVFRISMLPANHGDCLWIEYGSENDPHRVLIDGGPEWAFPHIQAEIPDGGCKFDLLVITHVDRDHIGGVLKLLTHLPDGVEFGDIWFNGWRHLPSDLLGPTQGEMVSAVIETRELPWNEAFGGAEEAVKLSDDGTPLELPLLPGGMKLTLLGPTHGDLARLAPKWKHEVEKAGLEPGSTDDALRELREREDVPPDLLGDEGPPDPPNDVEKVFVSDTSEANGSSIVLLAEFEGKQALLVGDAYPSIVLRALGHLTEGKLAVDALKLSHHGSKKNTNLDLIEALTCPHYLVSTDGSSYGHPNHAPLSLVVVKGDPGKTLHFNYRSEWNKWWDDDTFKDDFEYEAEYPAAGSSGLTVEL